jgi:GNAT superfamily N-acetyltransferase
MNVRQIESLSDEQREELYHLFQDEWWTEGRDRETIETMCSESDLLVAFCDDETDDLVAFARVLTDTVYKALIFDVVVAPAYRGEGLGSLLMDAIVEHPELAAVDQFEL